MCNFRRDIVFPGEIFPDSTPDWDTSHSSHEENVKENEKNDGKPGVMTRWWSLNISDLFLHSLSTIYTRDNNHIGDKYKGGQSDLRAW